MNLKQSIFNIGLIIWLTILTIFYKPTEKVVYIDRVDTIYLKEEIRFDTMQANVINMFKVCDSLGIKYPNIVVSQAVLESGNFKSDLFKKNNNPLGLYDSKNKKYYNFNHWTDAIQAYKDMIEYKHKYGEDYYNFLKRIGYAEDKNYIKSVKRIERNLNTEH